MNARLPDQPLRYAYVKHGDAVDQVRRLASVQELDRSGPDAFIGDLLQAHRADEIFVACRASRDEYFRFGNVLARSYPGDRAHGAGMMRRILSALQIAVATLRFRPHRVICGCTGELLWVSVLVAKLLRIPIVNSRHGELQERRGLGAVISAIDRLCIRACDAVVCHGPFMADQILRMGVPASRVFQFEVDLSAFSNAPQRTLPASLADFVQRHRYLFTFIGRVQRNKGVFDLLDAFVRLTDAGSIGLIYAGDGGDLEELRQRVHTGGASDHVLLLGRVPHGDLTDIMRSSTAVITPTRPEFPEGRCMVVLESLVLGVPVVGPRSGPFPYAIQHDVSGLLFEPGSADSLRDCLARIVADPDALERFRAGARSAGVDLLRSPQSFSQALNAAFDRGSASETRESRASGAIP